MAIAHTTLLAAAEGTPVLGVITTASVAVAANAFDRVVISMRAATSPAGGTFSVTGAGRTWVEMGRAGNSGRLLISFRSQGAGGSGALTLNMPTDAIGACWAVIETTGTIIGNNGADAISNVSVNGGLSSGSVQPNLTITGTPGATDETFADLMVEDAQTWTTDANFATDTTLVGTIETSIGCYHSTTHDQAFDVTGYATTSRDWGVVGGIFLAAASAPFVPAQTTTISRRPTALAPQHVPNLLLTTLAPAPAVTPFMTPLWPVIRPARRLDVSFASAFVIDDNAPFTSAIWALPARPIRRVTVDAPNLLTTTLAGVPAAPFVGLQPALIRPIVRRVEFFGPNLLLTTLAPVAPMPFAGLPALIMRPVVRRIPLDPANLLVALYGPVAPPFVQMMTSLTYTRARQVAPASLTNLLETTLAPPVAPFNPAWAGNSNRTVGF